MPQSKVLHQDLQNLWRELSALEAAYTTQKICFYQPIGKQAKFHAADAVAVRLVLGSNRSGKSVAGAVEAIAHSLGYRPWLPVDHPNRIVYLANGQPIPVPNVGRIIAQNYQQAIMQTVWPKIQEWAPVGWYKIRKDNRGIPVEILWKNGSRIHLMSNDQDDMAFEGTNGHWAWADEPIDYKKYIGLKRGLVDFSGHIWLTMTPLTQPWIHDVLVNRANDVDGQVRLFKFSIWDNCIENGGYLRRVDIEEFLSDLREDELEARLHGNFLHLAGRVYKEWDPEEPYWVPPFSIPATWPRVCVIDPHPRKPVAVLWIAINPDNQLFAYRDLFDPHLKTIADIADRIKELEGWARTKQGWERGDDAEPVVMRLIDASSKEDERTSGDTVWRRFQMEQIWCQIAKKRNAQAGYDAIHEALKVRGDWGEPGLIVFNTCRHVKQNFLNFCWDDWASGKQRDIRGDKQDVRKNHDDFIDGIRYVYQNGLTFRSLKHHDRRTSKDRDTDFNGRGMFSGVEGPKTRRERQRKWATYSESPSERASNSPGMGLYSTTRRLPLRRKPTSNIPQTE